MIPNSIEGRLKVRGFTPALLRRLPQEGTADKELSGFHAGERLAPIVHDTTYEALREVITENELRSPARLEKPVTSAVAVIYVSTTSQRDSRPRREKGRDTERGAPIVGRKRLAVLQVLPE